MASGAHQGAVGARHPSCSFRPSASRAGASGRESDLSIGGRGSWPVACGTDWRGRSAGGLVLPKRAVRWCCCCCGWYTCSRRARRVHAMKAACCGKRRRAEPALPGVRADVGMLCVHEAVRRGPIACSSCRRRLEPIIDNRKSGIKMATISSMWQ